MNPSDYLTDCPDVDECDTCGYSGEMVCDTFEGEYWILCPRCDELVFEGGEMPVNPRGAARDPKERGEK